MLAVFKKRLVKSVERPFIDGLDCAIGQEFKRLGSSNSCRDFPFISRYSTSSACSLSRPLRDDEPEPFT